MPKPTRHLVERSGSFYARIVVPKRLRAILGKTELSAPLRATGLQDARRKLNAVVAKLRHQMDVAEAEAKAGRFHISQPRQGQVLSSRQLAVAHYDSQMRFDDELRNTDHRYASFGFVDMDYVADVRRAVSGGMSDSELQALLFVPVRKFTATGNLAAPYGSPEWRASVRALAIAEYESLARSAERDEGDFNGKPQAAILTEKPQPVAEKDPLALRILGPDSNKSLSEIALDFIRERRASGQTEYECKRTAQMFEEHLEDAKPVYRIERRDVRAFKQSLSELPVNYTKRFPRMTVPQAIKANKAMAKPFDTLDPRTINEKYLSKLHSMLNWCVRNDVIPDNPAAGIKIDVVKDKGRPPRVPFSPSDLTAMFTPERFHLAKPWSEDQWAMLLALFTGGRASELAQLKLDSIRTERGLLVAAIEEETKTSGSQRLVPIHSTLLALGFEKRVKGLRSKGAAHFFPVWYQQGVDAKAKAVARGKVTLNHHFPKFIPKRFKVTYLPKVGIHDERKTFHSFRHTFKTGLARAGVPRSMQDDLCGHADHSAGAGYRHDVSVEAMKEAIEKLQFDGFSLSA